MLLYVIIYYKKIKNGNPKSYAPKTHCSLTFKFLNVVIIPLLEMCIKCIMRFINNLQMIK